MRRTEARTVTSTGTSIQPRRSLLQKLLDAIEFIGNKVPHPAVIFLILCALVIVLSHIFYLLGANVTYEIIDPQTHQINTQTTTANSLLTAEGIRFLFTSTVRNFMNFTAVGVIFVAMVGVGLAEEAGLIGALIRKIVQVAPRSAITFIIVLAGVLSSIASDAGYLVLIPLGAVAFYSIGRHPLAGMAAAFAGVGAVFGVNLLITPVDGIITEITNDAIHMVNPAMSINLTANLYFSMASTLLMALVCTFVTDRIVSPRLGKYTGTPELMPTDESAEGEPRGLRYAGFALLGFLIAIGLLTLPPGAPLRNPETGALIGISPFMDSLIVLIMLVFLCTGAAYGVGAGTITSVKDGIAAITKTFSGLGGLLFLFLVISQFVAYFNYSNLSTIAGVNMAVLLEQARVGPVWLLAGFISIVAVLNLIIPGIIPKWAIFAPIFVPIFMHLGVHPAEVLAAYRVGDSPGNVITPLMAYFGLIVVFAQRWEKDSGVGTVVALMLPYTVILYVTWTIVFLAWYLLGIPVGPG
ncbi:MAG TPA: AbgT family transporter [Candidatus Cybelea sp.]|jgi:aminobenzoyl-glutamate transport protein